MANKFVLFQDVGGNVKMNLNDEAKFQATVGSNTSASNNEVAVAKGVKGDAEVNMSKTATMKFDVGAADTKDSTDDKDKGDKVTLNVGGNVHVGGNLTVNDKSRKEDFSGAAVGTVNHGTLNSTEENCTTLIGAQKK